MILKKHNLQHSQMSLYFSGIYKMKLTFQLSVDFLFYVLLHHYENILFFLSKKKIIVNNGDFYSLYKNTNNTIVI